MIEVVTASPTFDLTTLDTVRAELDVTDNAGDAKLTAYIHQASRAIASYCNRVFAQETIKETLRLNRREECIVLSRYPVTSVSSVTVNDELLDTEDYEVDGETGIIVLLGVLDLWPRGKIEVVYVAGFELLSTLPWDVERAAILLVKQYAAQAGDRDPMIRSESIEGAGSTSYVDNEYGMASEVCAILEPYRKAPIHA